MTVKKPKKTAKKEPRVTSHFKPENLTYEEWQIALRRQYALEQHYTVKSSGENPVYSDFEVSNNNTKDKPYKVAIRSKEIGTNFCSCPDFTINTLGTCEHIEYIFQQFKKKKLLKLFKEAYLQSYSSIFLSYGGDRKVKFRIGASPKMSGLQELAAEYFDEAHSLRKESFAHFEQFLAKATTLDPTLRCYKDAVDYIVEVRDAQKRREQIETKYPLGKESSELDTLVMTSLHPYQKEAVLFAAKAGRCIIADEMGLGKTLEAIAATELMTREFGIEKVLIVCPTSLKYQWKMEIEKFSNRDVLVIEGFPIQRKLQYLRKEFFKIVSYDSVKNDLEAIQNMGTDLIILDEAQRIKNWETKTARMVKQLSSIYAIVLTGTPLENRLGELHSITEFIDRFRLGPLFRFLADHQILDKNGKVIGYKELHKVANTIAPILIRRRKKEVLQELPIRVDKICYVPMTIQQKELHDEHYQSVSRLVNKWRRSKFLSEKERQLLMIHLNCMRMVCDSTYILDQETRHDTKITELMAMLDGIFETKGKKVVIFSQWERMTRLVADGLEKRGITYEYLHGGIPSQKRKDLLSNFHQNEHSKVFLSTDAGSVGLNLQCASVLINLDCPWNPAVLEQRIARIHRMGQKESINVINFISSESIEEMILATLKFKKSVFEGVLDNGADEVFMGEQKFHTFMKGIETMITPSQAEAQPQGQSEEQKMGPSEKSATAPQENPDKTSVNPLDELLNKGLEFLNQLNRSNSKGLAGDSIKAPIQLSSFVEQDEKTGQKSLKIPLPSEELLNKTISFLSAFAETLKK